MYKLLFFRIIILVSAFYIGIVSASTKSPLPDIVTNQWQGLKLVGQTSLKKLGFHVYDASLWAEKKILNSNFSLNSNESFTQRNICVLSITYARNIKAKKLISATKKEWVRLGYKNTYPINEWIVMLNHIWPDVKKDDQLIVVSTPQGQSVFYNKEKRIGTIDDKNFGPAFLAIWVDENSRYRKNRLELIGMNSKELASEEQ